MDFQTGHFVDFEQFKIDSHFAVFGQVLYSKDCMRIYLGGLSIGCLRRVAVLEVVV